MSKRILITGGAGFIGHHVIDYLLHHTDYHVVSLDRLDISGSLNRLHEVAMSVTKSDRQRLSIEFHDLKAAINDSLAARLGNIDIILHLAASSHVDRSIAHPLDFVLDNVVGTANILDYARCVQNLERFVYFGTDEIFGPAPDGVFFKENDRYNCTNPYSASKAGAEELCVAYHNTYQLPIAVVHLMNVFGPRQHREKFIPSCIAKILKGETVTIHCDATQLRAGSRHYIHASDVSNAIAKIVLSSSLISQDAFGIAACPKINLAGSSEIDNLSLARLIASYLGQELKYCLMDYHSSRPGHDLRYALDNTAMTNFGWQPKSVHERLQETVIWYMNNRQWLL